MSLWQSSMRSFSKSNPTKTNTRNEKLGYTNRLNHIVNTSSSIPPLLDMREQMKNVRESNKTLPLSVYNGTTSRVK